MRQRHIRAILDSFTARPLTFDFIGALTLRILSLAFSVLFINYVEISIAGLLNSFSSVDHHAFSDNSVDPSR